ncbi:MAG: hypothetical protein ACP5M9_00130 [Candidatus Micrarchaeia archaeon]
MVKNVKKYNKDQKELYFDYMLFDKISKELKEHNKKIMVIRKNIAKSKKASSDLKFEFLENFDIITDHIAKAVKEINKSKKILKEL